MNDTHSPFLFSNYIYKWLDSSLDYGIQERDFWDMTLAELERAIESKKRVQKIELQERATFDYLHADLVGRSVARIYSSSSNLPDISTVYPTLFSSEEVEEKKQEKKAELSALRFKQFAESYNTRFKEVAKDLNERTVKDNNLCGD